MDSLVVYGVWIVVILTALGVLTITLFGLRSLFYGKVSPFTLVVVAVPLVLLVVLGFVMDDWSQAGILTVLITFALALLALLVSGFASMFT